MKSYCGIIYKATNIFNGKVYIGLTKSSLENRMAGHLSDSKNGKGYYFHRALLKHGFENFVWEIIDTAKSYNELCSKECYWIKEYKSIDSKYGYNLTYGGEGFKPNELIKEALKGHSVSDEVRQKISNTLKGRKLAKETIEKIRKSNIGFKHSEESKKKMRIAAIGRPGNRAGMKTSEETKEKIRQSNLGWKHTEEAKMKMSKAKKGVPWTEARRNAQLRQNKCDREAG